MLRLGSHCVLYADAIATQLEHTLELISLTDSEIVEIGARFFGTDRAEELRAALEKSGVTLAGIHTLLKVSDLLDNPQQVYEAYAAPARLAAAVGCGSLISSGMVAFDEADLGDARLLVPEQQQKAAQALNEVAKRIQAEFGVTIRYHNHLWEFRGHAAFYEALLRYAPDLQFAMDTGWVSVAGYDPVAYIEKYPERFRYFHLRDVNPAAELEGKTFREIAQCAFANVGEGGTNLTRLLRAMDASGFDCDGIIEYEFGEKDYHRYVKAVAYFRGMLAAIRSEDAK